MRGASADRGVSSTVATTLMVALVVVAAATSFAFLAGFGDRLSEPAVASLSAERTTVDVGAASDCAGPEELAVDVTLTSVRDVDRLYVIVGDEGGEETKVLWDQPGPDDVGRTLTLANEVTGPQVDVDIGGSGDIGYCPGDSATFRFYAENDGQTTALQTVEF
jgi:flagellin-like protein